MKALKIIIFALFLVGMAIILTAYNYIFSPNVDLKGKKAVFLYIPTGANYEQVLDSLKNKKIIKNFNSLQLIMKLKKYDKLVKPGRYKITDKMSNNELVNMLRAGLQAPLKLTFNNVKTVEQLAKIFSQKLETKYEDFIKLANDDNFLKNYGFNTDNILAMFIPNTYEFYWNTSAKQVFDRMKKEYDKFWTDNRLSKAQKINLSPIEVIILASIVQSEQMKHPDERPKIAGLYLNRLKKGIPLQADPTLIYSLYDLLKKNPKKLKQIIKGKNITIAQIKSFSIQRVYNWMKELPSPYNTYKNKGLPPGPIITPDISSIEAVLNAEKHNYIYMCAKEDFSGYHYFSKTLSQHLKYAKRYQQKLNQLGIK